MPAPAVRLLRLAGELASRPRGSASDAYLVGGPVRDLVLGRRYSDIDISVVGDGAAFASELAEAAVGEVLGVSEFGTAKLGASGLTVDVVTARRETYAAPAALPEVEATDIGQDLARRDFTVNAMGLALRPGAWGDLLDPHGGFSDTAGRRLRVLHDRSFQDDPSRILRALRYEARLGFRIEPGTLGLIERDRLYLGQLSAARTLAELEKSLSAVEAPAILARADELGVLAAIEPGLRISRSALKAMARVGAGDLERTLALISFSLTPSEAEAVVRRLSPPAKLARVISASLELRETVPILERGDLKNSEVESLLEPFPEPALLAALDLAPNRLQRQRLDDYLKRLRRVAPECTGSDLLAAGVPRGPLVGMLLADLKRARLDGIVRSKAEELALVERRLPLLAGQLDAGGSK